MNEGSKEMKRSWFWLLSFLCMDRFRRWENVIFEKKEKKKKKQHIYIYIYIGVA